MSTLLRLDGIKVGYGDMTAVHEASLEGPRETLVARTHIKQAYLGL